MAIDLQLMTYCISYVSVVCMRGVANRASRRVLAAAIEHEHVELRLPEDRVLARRRIRRLRMRPQSV